MPRGYVTIKEHLARVENAKNEGYNLATDLHSNAIVQLNRTIGTMTTQLNEFKYRTEAQEDMIDLLQRTELSLRINLKRYSDRSEANGKTSIHNRAE